MSFWVHVVNNPAWWRWTFYLLLSFVISQKHVWPSPTPKSCVFAEWQVVGDRVRYSSSQIAIFLVYILVWKDIKIGQDFWFRGVETSSQTNHTQAWLKWCNWSPPQGRCFQASLQSSGWTSEATIISLRIALLLGRWWGCGYKVPSFSRRGRVTGDTIRDIQG